MRQPRLRRPGGRAAVRRVLPPALRVPPPVFGLAESDLGLAPPDFAFAPLDAGFLGPAVAADVRFGFARDARFGGGERRRAAIDRRLALA